MTLTRMPSEMTDEQVKELYNNLELVKEGIPMKEKTYTISYKQKVKDDWVLVTRTGRSDSEEARGIVRDLIAGDIPEEHLEILLCSLEVGNTFTEFKKEGERDISE